MMPVKYACILVLMALLVACEKDGDPPEVKLLNGNYVNTDTIVDPFSTLKFKWKVTRGTAELSSFTLRKDGEDHPFFPVQYIPADVYIDSIGVPGPAEADTIVFSFVASEIQFKSLIHFKRLNKCAPNYN